MIRINIHEVKTHLSRYLKQLLAGESIVICKHNVPIAELRAVPPRRQVPRPLGLAKGDLVVPASFFEPLPREILDGFQGAPMKVLLDTCTFLWIAAGDPALSATARRIFESPVTQYPVRSMW